MRINTIYKTSLLVLCLFILSACSKPNNLPDTKNVVELNDNNIKIDQVDLKQDKPIRLLFFGDMMVDRHVGEKINLHGFDYLWQDFDLNILKDKDLISINLEGAITYEGNHYSPIQSYDFAFSPELIGKINKLGFNFFNMANNHFADQGQKGVVETQTILDELNINHSGCIDGQVDECSYTTVNIDDKKITMIGLSMVYKIFDMDKALEIIKNLKEASDLIIVNIHWGVEYEHQFNKTQQDIAHQLLDQGADMIIGHHPHVIQGLEIYDNKPIFYSLGNFIFDQYFSTDTQQGLALDIIISEDKSEINLLPLLSNGSKPSLAKDDVKNNILKSIALWSSVNQNIKESISNGNIILQKIDKNSN